MALNFPAIPTDGQLYPDPAIPGVKQWEWSGEKLTWIIKGEGVRQVLAVSPVYTDGPKDSPVVHVQQATVDQPGYMSAADKRKLDSIPDPTAATFQYVPLLDISSLFTGVRVSFPIRSTNGKVLTPVSPTAVMVSIDGEILTPYTDYNIIESDIIFASAPHPQSLFNGVALI